MTKIRKPKALNACMLADQIGELTQQAKHIAELLEAAKDEFKRREFTTIGGDFFTVSAVPGHSSYLDKAAVVQKLGADWVDAHTKLTPYIKIVARPLAMAKLEAA